MGVAEPLKPRNLSLAWGLAVLALLGTALLQSTAAFAAARADETSASSSDSSDEGDATSPGRSKTVPHWSSSFTDPTTQVTYPFTMVGSDPRQERSTTVKTEIIPLTFKFVAGNQDVSVLDVPSFPPSGYFPTALAVSMDGRDNVASTIASPVFTPADFPISGDTGVQYGDAFMRAQFGKVGTGYHVILGQPKVARSVSIRVPESKGVAVLNPVGVLVGRVDSTWFKERLARLIDDLEIKPSTLPIFLTNNVFLYQGGNFLNCCGLGGHGAGSPTSTEPVSITGHKAVRTFVFAAYIAPNSFPRFGAPFAGQSDIHSLSHEIAEWMANPFGGNAVQPYQIPTAPPGACSSVLETGDPVAGVWFPMPGNPDAAAGSLWHPQDGVFLNWFARDRESPDLAPADGRYTFMGALTTGLHGPFAAFGHSAQAC
jgi:hypothetical protein